MKVNYFLNLVIFTSLFALSSTLQAMEDSEPTGLNGRQRIQEHLRPDSHGRMRGEQGYGSPDPYPAPYTLPDIHGRLPGEPNYGWPKE